CGQSPLCVEVDQLVKSGVVVVVAAGNTGYGAVNNGSTSAGLTVTINDPGNADLAITVGATHRDMPHVYGVSYFSSKGPTGDGRVKPDLVAPGEKIISCSSAGRPAASATAPPAPPDMSHGAGPAVPHDPPLAPAQLKASCATAVAEAPAPAAAPAKEPPNGAAGPRPAVAPGATRIAAPPQTIVRHYKEDSRTNMAAPHVSGV